MGPVPISFCDETAGEDHIPAKAVNIKEDTYSAVRSTSVCDVSVFCAMDRAKGIIHRIVE